jgi:hypothetical protein
MTKHSQPAVITGRCVVLAVLVCVMLAGTSVAQADVIREERFTEPIVEDGEFCGIAVHIEGSFSARVMYRVGKGDVATAFFMQEVSSQSATVTNPLNGRFFRIEGKSVVHDLKATPLGGNLFRFESIEAGQPFSILDASGRVVIRNRGVIRTTVIADTRGDAVPGAEELEIVSVDVSGPHPGFDDAFFCSTIEGLLL